MTLLEIDNFWIVLLISAATIIFISVSWPFYMRYLRNWPPYTPFPRDNAANLYLIAGLARLKSGGIIVYPGSIFGNGYQLTTLELDAYLDWWSEKKKQSIKAFFWGGLALIATLPATVVFNVPPNLFLFFCC